MWNTCSTIQQFSTPSHNSAYWLKIQLNLYEDIYDDCRTPILQIFRLTDENRRNVEILLFFQQVIRKLFRPFFNVFRKVQTCSILFKKFQTGSFSLPIVVEYDACNSNNLQSHGNSMPCTPCFAANPDLFNVFFPSPEIFAIANLWKMTEHNEILSKPWFDDENYCCCDEIQYGGRCFLRITLNGTIQ